jgi:hypothetical protein
VPAWNTAGFAEITENDKPYCLKKGGFVKGDAPMCQVVTPGQTAKFIIKDGKERSCPADTPSGGWTCQSNAGPAVRYRDMSTRV